jgi:CheY-like chemotaxis protein
MSEKTVLVIDDSATIRRLVDSTLSPVGYSVALAADSAEGLAQARELRPDLIILDHQLPGMTGIEVCLALLKDEALRNIPVVASSTLRKKAYVEYADCPNVVDMLPKPYTAELLVTTVANALDTGSLVVDSQREGTAVPEVMEALGDLALTGGFQHFSLRSVLDFLNNAQQEGVLEVESYHHRVWIHIAKGRVQAVTASGISVDDLIGQLPDALQDLGPVMRLTVGSGSCAQIEGLVQLLDNKVLDPRLLQKLLRYQAAMLMLKCFTGPLRNFLFETDRRPPALHQRLPLDVSVAALLVEACLAVEKTALPEYSSLHVFSRKAIRGQNLDRAGLGAQHQKLLSQVNEAMSLADIAASLRWDEDEAHRVLYALVLADLVDVKVVQAGRKVVVLEPDPHVTLQLRRAAELPECPCSLKVVRDRLSLQLILKRQRPDVIVVALDSEVGQQAAQELIESHANIVWIGVASNDDQALEVVEQLDGLLRRPFDAEQLFQAINQACGRRDDSACSAV